MKGIQGSALNRNGEIQNNFDVLNLNSWTFSSTQPTPFSTEFHQPYFPSPPISTNTNNNQNRLIQNS